jgi:deoxyribonuclease-4
LFGSHLSIAGGLHHAVAAARGLAMQTVQVFTKNQQQWRCPPLEREAIRSFRDACGEAGFGATVSHDSYLINLASPDPALRKRSIDLFVEEIRRCDLLGIPLLVTHPGAHMGEGEAIGLKRVAASLDATFRRTPRSGTLVCLESTAGQGTGLGWRLEHLAEVISLSKHSDRLGVCLDTAHLFAAGYDWRGRRYAAFIRELEATVGLSRVRAWHLNDSKKPLGSRVDRHAHIGLGEIGDEGFRPIVRDKRWRGVPKILETPKGVQEESREWDAVNLERLMSLALTRAAARAAP